MKAALQNMTGSFRMLFNSQSDEAKGRIIALTSTLLATVYNVFITGIFYTGFLTMYGMSITDTGILTFMPFLANVLSAFSPMILSRFPKRKTILLASRVFYFLLYVVAVTVMPQFVHDTGARLTWFVVLVTVATAVYCLFSNGFTIWLYNFFPADNTQRLQYMTITQIFSSVLSSLIVIGSSFLTDALSSSPYQNTLILGFRYFAFVLVLVEVFVLAKAKEYPYQDSAKINLLQVFTLPFRYRKFMLCLVVMFGWNFIAYINSGLWDYHLLNHLNFTYTRINLANVLYTVSLLVLSPWWNRILQRYSWVKTLGIAWLLYSIPDFIFFFMTKENTYLFMPTRIFQNCMAVGINLAYSNLLYMNLPEKNSTAHITFYAIGCNIFAFLGQMTGTLISGITGDSPVNALGMQMYSVQITTIVRGLAIIAVGLPCVLYWRGFTSDAEIARVEQVAQLRARMPKASVRQRLAHMISRLVIARKKR